jgi:hypothetical protein
MTDFKAPDRDVNRAIRSWLHEDRHEDASRIAGAVLDQVETTQQRRATWWPAWRKPIMNKLVPIGLGVAAVVGVLAIGTQLLGPSASGVGGAPAASPSAAASPTTEPTPSAAAPSASPVTGLPVGSPYLLIVEDGLLGTVTVPAPGWGGDGGIMKKDDSVDPPDGAGMIVFVGVGLYVYGDPCQWSSTTPDTPATTVAAVVDALTAQASRDASAPVDVTLDGYTGKSVTLHVPDAAVFTGPVGNEEFSDCDQGFFGSWGTDDEPTPSRYHQGPGQIDELWILDVDGVLVVIDTAYYADTPVEHVEEVRAIVASITFE